MRSKNPPTSGKTPELSTHGTSISGRFAGKRDLHQVEGRAVLDYDWYGLRTAPQKEVLVAKILHGQGIGVLVPQELKLRGVNKYTRKRRYRAFTIVKGHVFFAMPKNLPPDWKKLFTLNLLKGVICDSRGPYVFPQPAVIHLAECLGVDAPKRPNYLKYMKTNAEFHVDSPVEIMAGPFKGHTTTVQAIQHETASVIVSFLGSERMLSVAIEDLKPAG